MTPRVLHLARPIRDGKPRMQLDAPRETTEQLTARHRGEYAGSLSSGTALAPLLEYAGSRHLADICGGSGGVAIGACLSLPGLRATIIDRPNVAPHAIPFIKEAGVQDRVSTLACDVVVRRPPGRYDAAVLRSVLQTLSPDHAHAVLRHVGQAMEPGGQIFIIGPLLDDTHISPARTVGFNLVFLNVNDDGLAFTEGDYRTWLTAAGFTDVALAPIAMPGGQSLITARKA